MVQVHVGTLVYGYQVIDAVGILDVLNSCGQDFAQALASFGPVDKVAQEKAPEFVFHHIGLTKDPAPLLTTGLTITPTCTLEDSPELDILLLPGPDPVGFELDPKYADFIRKHTATGRLVFTNCTGAQVAAQAGILDGKKATVNHMCLGYLRDRYPNVNWTENVNWVVDGNIWTAAGALTGMDMVAHWLKETYGREVMTLAARNLDYEPRDVNGVQNVIPKRYDEAGKQVLSHEYTYYDSYEALKEVKWA